MNKRITGFSISVVLMTGVSMGLPASAQQDDATVCFKGSGREAIAACTRRITEATGNNLAIVYHSRGYEYLSLRRFDLAIADFTQSIRINPSYINPYINRCLAYRGKGEFAKAVADATSALRIDGTERLAQQCLEKALQKVSYPES